jgi:hypothetical protein
LTIEMNGDTWGEVLTSGSGRLRSAQ